MRPILARAGLLLIAACGDNGANVVYSVSISPASPTVTAGKTLQFGLLSKGKVTWKVDEAGGGTLDAHGLYTPPATPGAYPLTATGGGDAQKTAKGPVAGVAAPP